MGKKPRSQQRKKGGSDSDAASGAAGGGGGGGDTMLDSEFLSEDHTIADSVTTFASNFDDLGGKKLQKVHTLDTTTHCCSLKRFTGKSHFFVFESPSPPPQ